LSGFNNSLIYFVFNPNLFHTQKGKPDMGNLLEMILKSQNGGLVKQIGKQHGLDAGKAFDAIRSR